MNSINKKSRFIYFAVGIAAFFIATFVYTVSDVLAEETHPKVELRRIISSENPLFVYSSVYVGAPPEQLLNFWNILPEDVKPYFGVHINPKKTDSPDNREWIETLLDAAQSLNIPAIIEVEGFASDNDTPMEYWSRLFERYPSLIGLNISEVSASGYLAGTDLDNQYMEKMGKYMEVCANHGGYFIWQDMAWDWPFPKSPHVFVKAGANDIFFHLIKKHKRNVILTHKHNGSGRRFSSDAAVMGFWASGYTAAWGVHSEGWMWWEAGYERLFEPSVGHERSKQSWKSVFTYPESLYGMEWLVAASGGASLFSLEAFFQGYSSCDGDRLTPAFEYVVLPTIRKILEYKLIPTREQVLSKIEIAYHPTKDASRVLREDHLFRGLYGPSESTQYEWLPSTGRYYFIPIIPVLAGKNTDSSFSLVIDDKYYAQNMVDKTKKKEIFDEYYPATGSGDSWYVNIGSNWYIANPNENTDITTTFEFPLATMPETMLSGSLTPHSFAIVREEAEALKIQLNNYRVDKSTPVWDSKELEEGKFCDYVKNVYTNNPPDSELRTSVLELGSKKRNKPEVKAVFGRHGDYSIENSEYGGTTIRIQHNGPVDIIIYP